MSSVALERWLTVRAARIARLRTVASGVDEVTESLILRLAGEFQGFARDLHRETSMGVVTLIAPTDQHLRAMLEEPYVRSRRLDRGNPDPSVLRQDYGLFGLALWSELADHYPSRTTGWNRDLSALVDARNGIVHDDRGRLERVVTAGWPIDLRSVDRWQRSLDGLAAGMDNVVATYIARVVGTRPW